MRGDMRGLGGMRGFFGYAWMTRALVDVIAGIP